MRRLFAMSFVVTLMLVAPLDVPRQQSTEPKPAALTVEVVPSAAPLTGINKLAVSILIGNPGGVSVTDVSVTVTPPDGVQWMPDDIDSGLTVAGGDTIIVRGALLGRVRGSAVTEVEVDGHSDGRTLATATAISHSTAPRLASLAVVGDSKLTNDDALRLTARVTNLGDVPIEAKVSAITTDQGDRIDEPTVGPASLSIAPGESGAATVTIRGDQLPTRSELATITAFVTSGSATEQLVETHPFSTTPFNDENLLGTLGLVSLLLLPGAAALAAWSYVRSRWRRRRGATGSWIPDLKNLGTLVTVVVLAAVSIFGFEVLTGENLYDGYDTATLLEAVAFAAAGGLVVGLLRWMTIWFWYPVVDEDTTAKTVFWKLRQWSPGKGTIDGQNGRALWVHDGAAAIVARVRVTGSDSRLQKAANKKSLWRMKWWALRTGPTFTFSQIEQEIAGGGITAVVEPGFRPTGKQDAIQHAAV